MSLVSITLNGNDITNSVISYEHGQNLCSGVATLDVVVDNTLAISFGLWDEVDLFEEGKKKGEFFLVTSKTADTKGTLIFECQDASRKLEDYFIADTYSEGYATTARMWIEAFLLEAGVFFNFNTEEQGATIAEDTEFGLDSAYSVIFGLLQLSGWYMYFDKNNIAQIGKLEVSLENYKKKFHDHDILSLQLDEDDKMARNRAVVWGAAGAEEGDWVFAESAIETPWMMNKKDFRTIVFSNSAIKNSASAQMYANRLVNEFVSTTYIKTIETVGSTNAKVGDVVLVKSQYFSGVARITSIVSSFSAGSGLRTILVLDERCPRLFAYYFFNDYVYIGTAGAGVWRKRLDGATWENYSNGIDDLDIVDLYINAGIFVCVSKNGYAYTRVIDELGWSKISPGEFMNGDVGPVPETDVKAVTCSIDRKTNYIYIGYNWKNDLRSWILTTNAFQTVIAKAQVHYGDIWDMWIEDLDKNSKEIVVSVATPAELVGMLHRSTRYRSSTNCYPLGNELYHYQIEALAGEYELNVETILESFATAGSLWRSTNLLIDRGEFFVADSNGLHYMNFNVFPFVHRIFSFDIMEIPAEYRVGTNHLTFIQKDSATPNGINYFCIINSNFMYHRLMQFTYDYSTLIHTEKIFEDIYTEVPSGAVGLVYRGTVLGDSSILTFYDYWYDKKYNLKHTAYRIGGGRVHDTAYAYECLLDQVQFFTVSSPMSVGSTYFMAYYSRFETPANSIIYRYDLNSELRINAVSDTGVSLNTKGFTVKEVKNISKYYTFDRNWIAWLGGTHNLSVYTGYMKANCNIGWDRWTNCSWPEYENTQHTFMFRLSQTGEVSVNPDGESISVATRSLRDDYPECIYDESGGINRNLSNYYPEIVPLVTVTSSSPVYLWVDPVTHVWTIKSTDNDATVCELPLSTVADAQFHTYMTADDYIVASKYLSVELINKNDGLPRKVLTGFSAHYPGPLYFIDDFIVDDGGYYGKSVYKLDTGWNTVNTTLILKSSNVTEEIPVFEYIDESPFFEKIELSKDYPTTAYNPDTKVIDGGVLTGGIKDVRTYDKDYVTYLTRFASAPEDMRVFDFSMSGINMLFPLFSGSMGASGTYNRYLFYGIFNYLNVAPISGLDLLRLQVLTTGNKIYAVETSNDSVSPYMFYSVLNSGRTIPISGVQSLFFQKDINMSPFLFAEYTATLPFADITCIRMDDIIL